MSKKELYDMPQDALILKNWCKAPGDGQASGLVFYEYRAPNGSSHGFRFRTELMFTSYAEAFLWACHRQQLFIPYQTPVERMRADMFTESSGVGRMLEEAVEGNDLVSGGKVTSGTKSHLADNISEMKEWAGN